MLIGCEPQETEESASVCRLASRQPLTRCKYVKLAVDGLRRLRNLSRAVQNLAGDAVGFVQHPDGDGVSGDLLADGPYGFSVPVDAARSNDDEQQENRDHCDNGGARDQRLRPQSRSLHAASPLLND